MLLCLAAFAPPSLGQGPSLGPADSPAATGNELLFTPQPLTQEPFAAPVSERLLFDEEQLLADFAAAELVLPATCISMAWLAPGGSNGFGTTDFDFRTSFRWLPRNAAHPIEVSPGVGWHLWSGPAALDLPPQVYDVYLNLSWQFLDRDWWGLSAGITPGFYGDFQHFDSDTFQLTGWLIGNWRLGEHWTAIAGVAYVRQLESRVLPVGGIIWQPWDDLRLEIVVPRPRISQRVVFDRDRESWIYASGYFGGGSWSVNDGPENVLVQYSDLRVSLGWETTRLDGRNCTAEIGYVFSRSISVDGVSLVTPDPTAYLQFTMLF
jgi:hypothetical protein